MNHEGMEVKGEDQEKLATALGTIAEVLVGKELESVRNSTAELDSKLSSCVDSLKEETTRAMNLTRGRMASRIDETLAKLAKLAEAEENRAKVVAELETRIGQLQEQVQAVKEDLAKNDLESVSETVTALQEKLQRQQANTERISTTLGSLANVLSGTAHAQPPLVQPPAPEPVPVEAVTDLPPAEPTQPNAAVVAVSEAAESGEIDNVLDRAFGGD